MLLCCAWSASWENKMSREVSNGTLRPIMINDFTIKVRYVKIVMEFNSVNDVAFALNNRCLKSFHDLVFAYSILSFAVLYFVQ